MFLFCSCQDIKVECLAVINDTGCPDVIIIGCFVLFLPGYQGRVSGCDKRHCGRADVIIIGCFCFVLARISRSSVWL